MACPAPFSWVQDNIQPGPDLPRQVSVATSKCVSRYGAQDLVGNVYDLLSDQLKECSNVTFTCNGSASSLDSGNIDIVPYRLDGFVGPGAEAFNYFYMNQKSRSANYFSVPLGLPMVGIDGGNVMEISPQTNPAVSLLNATKLHNDYAMFYLESYTYPIRKFVSGGYWHNTTTNGRFQFRTLATPESGGYAYSGVRCVLPVD